jgi:uncharacterized membrane protein YgdD (TMEM256/DUF423 family)
LVPLRRVPFAGDIKGGLMASIWILAASINGVLAVAAGAAGAHLFAQDPHGMELMSKGAQYEIYHAIALLALAALAAWRPGGKRLLAVAAWLFIAGTVLFSGGLYGLALTGRPVFAEAAPFGGTAFMLGWATLALYALAGARRKPT